VCGVVLASSEGAVRPDRPAADYFGPLHRLETFWSATIGGEIPVENASPPEDVALTEEQVRQIRTLYTADLNAYELAVETFDATLEALS